MGQPIPAGAVAWACLAGLAQNAKLMRGREGPSNPQHQGGFCRVQVTCAVSRWLPLGFRMVCAVSR